LPHEVGITGNVQPLPERTRQQEMGWLFRNAGYDTAYAGKWHLPKQTMEQGHGFAVLCEMNDAKVTGKSVEFLRAKRDRPFLLVASYFQPHGCCTLHRFADPRQNRGTAWPADAYEPSFLERCPELPPNFAPAEPRPQVVAEHRNHYEAHTPEERPAFWAPQEDFNAARNWTDPATYRHYRWAYYRIVEKADAQIAPVLRALHDSGQAENTLVVFSSDHGDMMGAHGLVAKEYLYEESVRVPLLMSFPGRIPAGRVVSGPLVSNGLDLIPTLCDYAGIVVPEGLQGKSLRGLAETGRAEQWRDQLVIETHEELGAGRLLHTGRYKYMAYNRGANPEELFDLQQDPGELRNLARDPAHLAVLQECRRRLSA